MPDSELVRVEGRSDAELVAVCLAGDRTAFGEIVGRYQRLLCSLAYSRLGNIGDSEDVAQEAFVEGWKRLATLKEPEKLKSWLCGILKFKISRKRRSESRRPSGYSEALEEAGELVATDQTVEESAMKDEEQELLWTALEKVPEIYREPLVLYYREHRSVEHVAYELDLTESAVKQRLARGRKMLKERMMGFVEEALARSTPGRVFTVSVLAALPNLAVPTAKAAGLGAVAAKASSSAKAVGLIAFLASISGFISGFFALRMNLDQARTPVERRAVVKTTIIFITVPMAIVAGLLLMIWGAVAMEESRVGFAIASQVLVFCFVLLFPLLTARLLNAQARLRSRERAANPDLFSEDEAEAAAKKEYRSKATLFGVPLVHVKFAMAEEGEPPVFAWIALGDKAYGLLFALGGFAAAPVSVGIVTAGLVTCSVVGIGLFGIGTVGIGILALGAMAIGVHAYGSLSAVGWEAATGGGFAIAREGAIGPIAFADQVNNEQAAEIINLATVQQNQAWVLGAVAFLTIVPMFFWAKAVRNRFRKGKK